MITKNRTGSFGIFKLIAWMLLILILMSSAVSASDWEQFQKDSYNSGVTSDKAPITYPVGNGISWAAQPTSAGLGAGFDSTFVVIDDVLYVVGWDHVLRVLYMVNGTQIWETSTNGGGFHLGSIAAGNGSIFVPTVTGMIYALNSTTGALEWYGDERIPFATNPNGYLPYQFDTPVVYEDHRIYFGGWTSSTTYADWSKYFCYYDNGTKCWDRNCTSGASGYYWAGAAIIDDCLVYGDYGGTLVSVDKLSGNTVDELNLITEFGVGDSIKSSVCYAEDLNRIYFTSTDGYIYSLGMNADGTFNTTDSQYADIVMSSSTPAYYNGRVYVGSGGVWGGAGTGLSCFNASNLSDKLWVYSGATAIQSSPVISTAYDDGDGEVYIYFTTNVKSGTVYCINESGVKQWSYTPPSSMNEYTLQGVTISDGWLFYGNDRSYVFGLATNESLGKVVHVFPGDSLQETIYAANNGDTIMMSPGTYVIDSDLYINKSGLTFMPDGGEVIIAPNASADDVDIIYGLENASDTTGCDASGITFNNITFGAFKHIGQDWDDTLWVTSLQDSNISYEGCTFNDVYTFIMKHNAVLKDSTFETTSYCFVKIMGDNVLIEGTEGNARFAVSNILTSGATSVRPANFTFRNNIVEGGTLTNKYADSLIENNSINTTTVIYVYNTDSTIRNNTFISGSYMTFEGQVYENNFIDGTAGASGKYVQFCEGGTYYLNSIIDYPSVRMYSANYSTSAPVTYTYDGASHTGYLGNYYALYAGIDADGNGVGDGNLTDSSYGGVDNYPLMGAWIATENRIEGGQATVSPVADFSANITSGNESLIVQFTDLSVNEPDTWSWDFDGDGIEDSAEQNPQFTYTEEGTYNVSLTAGNSAGSDTVTKESYITVSDWNPWNDADSEGSPDGSYITVSEFIEAYNCYQSSSPAPGTGASVDISRLIELYNAYSDSTPM